MKAPKQPALFTPAPRQYTAIDLFCGGGGFSEGAKLAGVRVLAALNHCESAIRTHAANHPHTHHARADVWLASAAHMLRRHGLGPVDLVLASPSCQHFSRAKGGQPLDRQIRSQPYAVLRYVAELREAGRGPRALLVENVPEMATWGPLGEDGRPIPERKGEFFRAWVEELRQLGAIVDWRVCDAADDGAPTHRRRLFVQARFDGVTPTWSEPTHGPGRSKPWVPVATCIDWGVPSCSIFAAREEARTWAKANGRGVPVRPLAANTLRRVAKSIERYVLYAAEPFIVNLSHGGRAEPLDKPIATLTATPKGGDRVLVQPVLAPVITRAHGHGWDRDGGPAHSPDQPLPTLTCTDEQALVAASLVRLYGHSDAASVEAPVGTLTATFKEALVVTHLAGLPRSATSAVVPVGVVTRNGERQGQVPRTFDMAQPAPTVTAKGSQGAVAFVHLAKHYGGPNGEQAIGQALTEPCATITTTGQLGPVAAIAERVVAPALAAYYGSERDGQDVGEPMRTATTKDRFAAIGCELARQLTPEQLAGARRVAAFLCEHGVEVGEVAVVQARGELYVIIDITLRMLEPRELARAQGFPDSYIFEGTRAEIIERVGNSVAPPAAAARIRDIVQTLHPRPRRRAIPPSCAEAAK